MKASDRILSKRYASGYLDLEGSAKAKQGKDTIEAAITQLMDVRSAAHQAKQALHHPLIGYDEKNEILAKVLPKGLMLSRAAEFTRLLLRENRFYLLESIITDCRKLYNAYAGIMPALAKSRQNLDDEEKRRLTGILSTATGTKVELSNVIEEGVIGGLEIKIGDLLIDATVRGRLERLKNDILAN